MLPRLSSRDSSAKIFSNVILDKDGDDDDEDDQFLVEAVPQIAEMTEIAAVSERVSVFSHWKCKRKINGVLSSVWLFHFPIGMSVDCFILGY